jgi:hypothetical protein
MQPLSETVLTRAWHWGIAIVGAADAEVPDVLGQAVTVGESAVVISVRHAQDLELESELEWATATIYVRVLAEAEPLARTVLCDVTLPTPNANLAIGDADEEVILPTRRPRTRVIVSAEEPRAYGIETAWIDLIPVEG